MLGEKGLVEIFIVDQTDRIQGLARFMNKDGSSTELMNLLLVFAGMLSIVLVLRWISAHNQKKREAELRRRLKAKKANAAKKTPTYGKTKPLRRTR